MMKHLVVTLFFLILPLQAYAQTAVAMRQLSNSAPGVATAMWDANTDGVTVGYRVYYGLAPMNYDTVLEAGMNTMLVVSNLTPGLRYYFAVRAYNAAGAIGPPSNEVSLVLTGQNCAGAINIAVRPPPGGWSQTVDVGFQGEVLFRFAPFPSARIVEVEARLGTIVAGHATAHGPGDDLRGILGLVFSVPRTPGPYPLFIWAKDENNCETVTTSSRIVTVN